jgi:OmpA-OmpF porin, OOP family
MNRIATTLLFLFLFSAARSQGNKITDSNSAKVNVFVTDMKGKPSRGEQILFKNERTKQLFSGRSDAMGKFSLQLPPGASYTITIKSLTDTSKYGKIDIPSLGPDEFFSEPFRVDVKFQMAKNYTLDNVHFDFGKASLRSESFAELDELVDFLKNKETVRVEIAGHTDNVGNEADNLRLSQQRSETIRGYLIKKGIQAARIVAKGYGASQPIADNNTDQGRQLNRRTEVRVL